MIDIESYVFSPVASALRTAFPGIFVTGERVSAPARFPAVSIVEIANTPYTKTMTQDIENHVELTYEANVFSNLEPGKKQQCRAVAAVLDDAFARLGFRRILLEPVDNLTGQEIYRMVGRYTAVAGKDMTIYRR